MENCVDVQTWNRIHEEVERQICFEAYEGTKNGSVVSEIVELMTEICCMPGGMMRISGVPYSVEVVKKRFRELTSSHIDTLLWSMKRSSPDALPRMSDGRVSVEDAMETANKSEGVGADRE